jgi:hypothetical protein
MGDVLHTLVEQRAVDRDLTILMFFKMIDTSDQSRFARARRPADYDPFALGNGQVDVFQDMEIPVPFVDLLHLNDGLVLSNAAFKFGCHVKAPEGCAVNGCSARVVQVGGRRG